MYIFKLLTGNQHAFKNTEMSFQQSPPEDNGQLEDPHATIGNQKVFPFNMLFPVPCEFSCHLLDLGNLLK